MSCIKDKNKFAKIVIVLAVACLFAGMVKLLFEMKYQEVVTEKRAALQETANYLDLQLYYRLSALELLAGDHRFLAMDSTGISLELKRIIQVMGFFNAVVFDINGNFIAEASLDQHVGEVYDIASFREAAGGKAVVSGRISSNEFHNDYISLRVPITCDNGMVRGVLVAGIMADKVKQMFAHKEQEAGSFLFILDKKSNIVAYSLLSNVQSEADALKWYQIFSSHDKLNDSIADRVEGVSLEASLKKADWKIVMVMPLSLVYAKVIRSMAPDLLLILLLCAIIALAYRTVRQTQAYKAEREHMRMEHLKSLSLVAAGLAHEIRNPLTAIKGFVDIMSKRSGQLVPKSHIYIMKTELERIDRLTEEFQMLARPMQATRYDLVDLIPVVKDVMLLCEQQAFSNQIKLCFHIVGEASQYEAVLRLGVSEHLTQHNQFHVLGSERQLKQLLLNLVRNALESISSQHDGYVQVILSYAGRHVSVAVQDNGQGIEPQVLSQLGTPFFTTKECGTGLGLLVCYNIVQQHGGKLEIASVPSCGTTISILLPRQG